VVLPSIGRVHRQNQFADRPASQSLDQFPNLELVRADTLHRVDDAAQHVVQPLELAGFFERDQVARVGDHANLARVAAAVAANVALFLVGKVEAVAAIADPLFHLGDGIGKRARFLVAQAKDIKSEPLGGLRPMPGIFSNSPTSRASGLAYGP
jgi:hypothetical protein